MNRRKVLAAGVTGTSALFSGCTSFLEDEVQLASLIAINGERGEQEVEVRVRVDDSAIVNTDLSLPPREEGNEVNHPGTRMVNCEWPEEPRRFVVDARIDDEWKSVDLAEEVDGDCATVNVMVGFPVGPDPYIHVSGCEGVPSDPDLVCPFYDPE